MKKRQIIACIAVVVLLLAGFHSPANAEEHFNIVLGMKTVMYNVDPLDEGDIEVEAPLISDPIEGFNRAMFTFNDKLYFWFMKPLAQGWGIIPETGRIGLRNFFDNLGWPVRFFNCLFQGKGAGAGTEFSRFLINTTIGVVGFSDPAQKWFDLKPYKEDFGQTLGVWGAGHGFFLTCPCVGPLTLRDGLGKIPDTVLNPLTFVPGADVIKKINEISLDIGEYESIKQSSLDPYIGIRDAYLQWRNSLTAK
jgi:phospholipid-binding lipoprotein MlaA